MQSRSPKHDICIVLYNIHSRTEDSDPPGQFRTSNRHRVSEAVLEVQRLETEAHELEQRTQRARAAADNAVSKIDEARRRLRAKRVADSDVEGTSMRRQKTMR